MAIRPVWLMLGVLLSSFHGVTATCYKPDTSPQISDYNPCFAFHGDNSFCCVTHRTQMSGNSSLHDNCLPSGLCQWASNGTYSYWREGCSNSSWPSEWCLTGVCGDGHDVDQNGNAQMTPCDNTSTSLTWCCGRNNTACCGKGAPAEITLSPTLAAYATLLSSSSALSASTSTPATTPATISASTSVPTVSQSSTMSGGEKAGIGVGVALGVLILIAVLIIMRVLLRRRRARVYPQYVDSSHQATEIQNKYAANTRGSSRAIELASQPAYGERAELDASTHPGELYADQPKRGLKHKDEDARVGSL